MYIVTNGKKGAHITVRPVGFYPGEVYVEIMDGLEYIYPELPPCFDIGPSGIVQGDAWEEYSTLVINRMEDGHSANWFLDCVCFDVILEPHELAWFK